MAVVDIQIFSLFIFPPFVTPLEDVATDRIANSAIAIALAVHFLPLSSQETGLCSLVFCKIFGIERIGAKFKEQNREIELLIDVFPHRCETDTPVGIDAQQIQFCNVFLDQIDILDITIHDCVRPAGIDGLTCRDNLVVQAV